MTGDYLERGITRLHGFAAELVAEAPEHLVPVPATLGRLGVLAEPASVCERGLRHVRAIGGRQPWGPRRAHDDHKERLVQACGARFVATDDAPLRDLAGEVGGFDVVLEAAGDAQVMLD